jgi:aconitate hydratase A / 2-methylisocitrate dehydratase
VLGWGVGGIEAEAAMLGQAMSMLIPQVLGFKLGGQLPAGATATDLVLTVTQRLRERGVVGMFVEFFGDGVASLPLADRATIGNMSPEFGSTCAIFPIDAETLRYLEFSGRPKERIELVEAYAREQGLWHERGVAEPTFTDVIELDLGEVVPSIAGPKRPQDRISLVNAQSSFRKTLRDYVGDRDLAAGDRDLAAGDRSDDAHDEAVQESYPASDPPANGVPGHEPLPPRAASAAAPLAASSTAPAAAGSGGSEAAVPPPALERRNGAQVSLDGERFQLGDGDVVIAAITSCTNTSNPSVMIGAGILARNAVQRGLRRKPWVKTSLAPGSKVVTEYLDRAQLTQPLEQLGFNLVGYGCTTCIGNSGPLPQEISAAVAQHDLAVVSVLSGNRNFEGRINPDVKMNYLASPPLCVAYALAGTMDIDLAREPLGLDADGSEVRLADIWPDEHEVAQTIEQAVRSDMFRKSYAQVFAGDARWHSLHVPTGERFDWEPDSTYVRLPPYFEGMPAQPRGVRDVADARVLALLGDSVTTDHISPAGSIKRDGPAGAYLLQQGVAVRDFNSYGSRRGNHEVMMRGTFANIRLRNLIGSVGDGAGASQVSPLPEGGFTYHFDADGSVERMSIYDAAMRYAQEGVPLIVLGGREYGSGSSRDWAAKGTLLLGVRAVIAAGFERIHRSNLVGMGVLPLQFPDGESAASLRLLGEETISISGLEHAMAHDGQPPSHVRVSARRADGSVTEFDARVRIDTPREAEYFAHGGILQYVLRRLLAE